MAIFDVSGYKKYCELREQIFPAGLTHLVDRTNHYNFGTKTQEFAVPPGVDVSIIQHFPPFLKQLQNPNIKLGGKKLYASLRFWCCKQRPSQC